MTNPLDFKQELLSKIKEGIRPSQLKGQNFPVKPNNTKEKITTAQENKAETSSATNSQPTNHQPLFTTPQLLIIAGSLLVMVYLLTK